jgi:hypothetical protein
MAASTQDATDLDSRGGARASYPPPYPDPTALTTEALRRDVQNLKDLLHAEMAGQRQLSQQRFEAIAEQFALVERVRVEQKRDSEVSIAAALTSAKEVVVAQTAASQLSIGKSETAFLKSLDQLSATFTTAIDSLRREILDNKDRVGEVDRRLSSRLDTGEGRDTGAESSRSVTRQQGQLTAQWAAVFVAVVLGAGAILAAILEAAHH